MTANQRRPGFRLPWSSDHEGAEPASEPTSATNQPPADAPSAAESTPRTVAPDEPSAGMDEGEPSTADVAGGAVPEVDAPDAAAPTPDASPAPSMSATEAPETFLRDLVEAMRGVAEEARDAGLADLRAQADAAVKQLQELAERRRAELRERSDADVAAVGEWATAEAERIRREAESRVAARKAQLEEQLAAESRRTEAEARAVRERVAEYERELEAYHRQLAEIHDPAAFAAAAKRMPKPPALTVTAPPPVTPVAPVAPVATMPTPDAAPEATPSVPATNGTSTTPTAETTEIHPAEEEVLAARLATLDAQLEPARDRPAAADPASEPAEPTTTDVVVKGLGSFGAITGFRQSLAGVAGIDGVALSLGSSGEFIFRTTHRPSVDVAAAISGLEGDGATVERRPDGTLAVTLDRAR